MEYFAQDEATRARSGADGLRNARERFGYRYGAAPSAIFSAGSSSRATTCTRRWPCSPVASAPAWPWRRMLLRPVEHAAARRADESPRPRFEGCPPRGARRLRGHAHHRRRTIGTSSNDSRRRSSRLVTARHSVYPGTYPDFLWHKEQLAGSGNGKVAPARPTVVAPPTARAPKAPPPRVERPPHGTATGRLPRGTKAGRGGTSQEAAIARRTHPTDRGSRVAHRRARGAGQGPRSHDVESRFLRESRDLQAGHRSPPVPDVGGRRSDRPVGGASGARDRVLTPFSHPRRPAARRSRPRLYHF